MANAVTESVTVTTNSSGAATAYTTKHYTGKVNCIIYTKTDFATGVDFTITTEDTGQTVWTELNVDASTTDAPLQASHTTAGVATSNNDVPVLMCNERLKIVIASGGDTKTGAFRLIVEGVAH